MLTFFAASLSIGEPLTEYTRDDFILNKTVTDWFDRNEASLPKSNLKFSKFCFYVYFHLFFFVKAIDYIFSNVILVGKALAGQWLDVEKYFNEFEEQFKSTLHPNKIK